MWSRGIPAVTAMVVILCALPSVAMDLPPVVRGSGTVLLMPEQGPLTMTFYKRDLNIYDGPDAMPISVREPLGAEVASVILPDDGQTGKGPYATEVQEETVTVQVTRPGLYRVVFSGGDLMFGMSANCERYVIESGLTFNAPDTAGKIYFQPPEGEFVVAAAPLHRPGIQTITLHDAGGSVLNAFELVRPVEDVEFLVTEELGSRDGLWHFDIGKLDVTVTLRGVRYWTVDPASYFDAAGSHLILAPRNTARYLSPGGGTGFRIVLYPPEDYTGGFAVRIAQPEQEGVRFELADPAVQPVDYATDRMIVPVTVTADARCRAGAVFDGALEVQASDNPPAAAAARLQVRIGPSPVSRPLDMPIVLEPHRHEDWQFGYAPEYEPNEVYFDLDNSPWLRHRTEHRHWSAGALLLEDGGWVLRPFTEAIRERFPGYQRPSSGSGFNGCRWAFDDDGGAWTVMRLLGTASEFSNAILYTPDRGRTWQTELIDGELADLEAFTGHNHPGTPAILAYRRTAPHPAKFCAYHDLLLYLPRLEDGKLVVPEPIVVSDNCLGGCVHSGAPPTLATRDGRTHIVWGEVTDAEEPGVPTYIATFDHATGELSEKVFIAHAPPVNDVHNVPAVVLDSEGFLHVITGAHGDVFFYRRSLRPNDIAGGFTETVRVLDWTEEEGIGRGSWAGDGIARQTYIGLVCDEHDALHIAYRQSRSGVDSYLPDFAYYTALSCQSKPKGEPWGPARLLVVPPVGGYSIYYHKLTVDRTGRLYLSYSYWTNEAYQKDFPGLYHNRAVLTSTDGGESWKLAETADFIEGMEQYRGR